MKTNSKEVVVELELPGFKKEDIDVKVTKNKLFVRAKNKKEKSVKRKDFFHEEMTSSAFSYATSLPDVDSKRAKIEFKGGLLRITAPRIR